ncbi:MAG TPA: sigma-70 family RNA polymerase sigma factor [Anaeromyxobacter sp.]|nr:sigma-70 family RNA polymerase sigma factor [Anaeromyxobacter sp.]
MAERPSRAAELYALYGPAVYRRCLRLLRDEEAARDATQDVFVKAVTHMDRLEDRENAMGWLYTVATRHCLNVLRDRKRHGERTPVDDLELAAPASASPADRVLARSLLAQFDVGTQEVALGVLVDGMEQEELASALGISRKTVQRRLERFLSRARAAVLGSEP